MKLFFIDWAIPLCQACFLSYAWSMKKSLLALPLIAALGCAKSPPLKDATESVVATTDMRPRPAVNHVELINDDIRAELFRAVNLLGSDLCERAESKEIAVKPFSLKQEELDESLSTNQLDALAWNIPKNVSKHRQHLEELFVQKPDSRLPFCHSHFALREGLLSLKLDENLKKKVDDCFAESYKDNDGNVFKLWRPIENGLDKAGEAAALGVCIAHYGGDYDVTRASRENGKWTVSPSCFETVAATHYGYPPASSQPYTAYLESQKTVVTAEKECLLKMIKDLPAQ